MNARQGLLFVLALAMPAAPGQQRLLAIGAHWGDQSSNLYEITAYRTAPAAVDLGETGVVLTDIAVHPTTGEIYAIDGTGPGAGGTLYRLDPTTHAATPVGPLGTANQTSLEFDGAGRLWCWGSGVFGELRRLDPQTAVTLSLLPTPFPGDGDLACDLDGTLYGSSQNWIVSIEADNGGPTSLQANLGHSGFLGLEIDEDGTMFGLSFTFDSPTGARLWLIDHRAGVAQVLSDVQGGTFLGANGLAFVRSRGLVGYGAGAGVHDLTLAWLPGTSGSLPAGLLKLSGFDVASGFSLHFLGTASKASQIPFGAQVLLLDPGTLTLLPVFPDALGEVSIPIDLSAIQLAQDLWLQAIQIATSLGTGSLATSRGVQAHLP